MTQNKQALRAHFADLPLQAIKDAIGRSREKEETALLAALYAETSALYIRKDWPAIQERVQRVLEAGLVSSESTLSYQSGRRERRAYFKKYDAERAALKKLLEAADANCW